jgi:hypothetical protein
MDWLPMTAGIPMNVWTPVERGEDSLTGQGGTDESRAICVLQTIGPFQRKL